MTPTAPAPELAVVCTECLPPVVWWKFWDAGPFLPRRQCGNWPEWLMVEWGAMGLTILLLYLFVAYRVWQVRRRAAGLAAADPTFPRWAFGWISGFFVCCGVAHALNPSAFLWPAYLLHIQWEALTVVVSTCGALGVHRLAAWVTAKIDALTAERDAAREQVARVAAVLKKVSITAIPWDGCDPVLIVQLIKALGEDDPK